MIKKTLLTLAIACVAGVTASAAPADGATRASGGSAGRMFGYNSEFNATNVRGLYELNTTGQADLMWYDDLAYPEGPDSFFNCVMTAGWIRNGRLCGFQSTFPYFSASYIKYVEHDLEDGELLVNRDLPVSNSDWTAYWITADYCPMNDRIYGFGFDKGGAGNFTFRSAPASDPSNITTIRQFKGLDELCYGVAFNTNTGELIGIHPDLSMVSINLTTGVQTNVYTPTWPTGHQSDLHGFCYDASNNKYYCNYYYTSETTGDDTSYLYEIDLERRSYNRVANYNAAYQFNFLVVDGAVPSVSAMAPEQVATITPNFSGDTLSGSFDFTLPEQTVNGEQLNGTVIWKLYYDGRMIADGSGQPGEKVSAPAEVSKGFHTVRVQCSANGVEGRSTVIVPLLGGEVPLAPENVKMTRTEISWDAVTEGLSGEALTASDITYQVDINDKTVGTTKSTSFDITEYMAAEADKSLAAFTATVYAQMGKNLSAPAKSNKIIYGTPLSLPVKIDPTEAQANLTIAIDANKDNTEWEYYTTGDGEKVFCSAYGDGTDDWLFLPQFDPKNAESVKFDAIFAAGDETLLGGEISVYIGTEPTIEAMTTVVIPDYIINVFGEQPLRGTTILAGDLANASELYYGVRMRNKSLMSPVYLYDINITEGDSKINGPAVVTDITVTPNETNNKKLDISFKLPTATVAGTAIPSDATIEADVFIDSSVTVSGKPGENVTAAVYGHQGDNLLIITPSVNGIKGAANPMVFFTGDDLPGMVTDLKITYDETNCSMRVDFTPPTEGFYGGSLANSSFKYEVYQFDAAADGYVFAAETPIGVNYATLDVPLGSALTQFNAGIRAVNAVGACPQLALFTGQIGTPHKLNMIEDFEGDEFLYTPLMPFTDKSLTWGWQRPERLGSLYAIDSDYAFTCQSSAADVTGRLDLPKFSATGFNNVELKVNLWNGQNGATTKVYAEGYKIERTLVETIECGSNNNYNEASVVLPQQFSDCPWILISLEYEFAKPKDVAILTQYSVIGNKGSVNEMETILGSVFGKDGEIVVNGYRGREIAVYTIDGKLMKKVEATSDNFAFPMQKGLYAVRVGNQSTKVVVR